MEVIVVADVEMEQLALHVRRRIAIIAGGEKPYILGSIPFIFSERALLVQLHIFVCISYFIISLILKARFLKLNYLFY